MPRNPYLNSGGTITIDTATEITGNLTVTGNTTVTGTATLTGAVAGPRPVVSGTADVAVPASASGTMYVSLKTSGTQTYTLPAAAAGLTYTFVCGHADTELFITPASGDAIVGKIHAAENGTGLAPAAGTGIENTTGTNVVGDFVTLTAVDGTTWYMTSLAGVWASQ